MPMFRIPQLMMKFEVFPTWRVRAAGGNLVTPTPELNESQTQISHQNSIRVPSNAMNDGGRYSRVSIISKSSDSEIDHHEAPPTSFFPKISTMKDGLTSLPESNPVTDTDNDPAMSKSNHVKIDSSVSFSTSMTSRSMGLFPSSATVGAMDHSSISILQPNLNIDDYHRFNEYSDPLDSSTNPRDFLDAQSIIDDAGSSVCIDDSDSSIDVQDALKVLNKGKNKLIFTGKSNEIRTDFDEYNERVARDIVVQDKARKGRKKRVRRRPLLEEARNYGNYFRTENNDSSLHHLSASANPLSYELDNFDGNPQNIRHNHRKNQLNSKFTYEESHQRRRAKNRSIVTNKDAFVYGHSLTGNDNLSFATVNLDILEAQNDDEDIFSDEENRGTHVKRGLYSRQLQMMALTGSLGVGLLLNSGYILFSCGPLGTLLGHIFSGFVTCCTMVSFGEMISLIPSDGTTLDLISRMVDDSLGFTAGIVYWICCVFSQSAEITAAAIMLSYYPILDICEPSFIVWVTLFIFIILLVSLTDISAWGELQFLACVITLITFVSLLLTFCMLNSGAIGPTHDHIGFRYWDSSKSEPEKGLFFGPFRPVYLSIFQVLGKGPHEDHPPAYFEGIGGNVGRFIQLWAATCTSMYTYMGTETVYATAAEARNPRKSLPAATRNIFYRIIFFYILAVFLLCINVYAGDAILVVGSDSQEHAFQAKNPQFLLKCPGSGDYTSASLDELRVAGTSFSPWILALKEAGLCGVGNAANAFFIFFSLATACNHLYAASRTLYAVGQRNSYFSIFRKCSYYGIPYISVTFSWMFSGLAYLAIAYRFDEVFIWLSTFTAAAGLLVYGSMNLSFIRFFYGLKLRTDIFGRNDAYYPYKSPLQPYTAYFGLFSCIVLSLFFGVPVFVHDMWDIRMFFMGYIPLVFFIVCYVTHKLITGTTLVPLAELDLDSCRKTIDNIPWKEDRVYHEGIRTATKKYYYLFLQIIKKYHQW